MGKTLGNGFQTSSILKRFAVALLLPIIAVQVRWLAESYASIAAPFLPFLAAIMFTAWYTGFQAGLLSMVLSALLIDYYFMHPIHSFGLSAADAAALGLFVTVGTAVAYFSAQVQSAWAEAVRRQSQLQRLHEFGQRLFDVKDVDHMQEAALSASVELLHADKGAIQLYDPRKDVLEMVGHVGINEAFVSRFRHVPVGSYACGAAFKRMQQVIITNVSTDPMFSSLAHLYAEYDIAAVISTPLFQMDGQAFGVLSVYFAKPEDFRHTDLDLLQLYAAHAAKLLEWKRNDQTLHHENRALEKQIVSKGQQLIASEYRLRTLVSELAVTEERERRQLASELHDYLAQMLALARIRLKQAERALQTSTEEAKRSIGEVDEVLRRSSEYARTLMAELNPPGLRESGLPAALRWLIVQMPTHGLTVDLDITYDRFIIPYDQAVLLYQSIRELLLNVVKHAGVDRARVSLTVDANNALVIVVRDTGAGFDVVSAVKSADDKHFGLSSIRERMRAMGGWFQVDSALGKGSTMTLHLPLQYPFEPNTQNAVKAKPAIPSHQESLPLN